MMQTSKKTSIHYYDDIIDLPHPDPDPKTHIRMPVADRAAQFKPFAALTGYADVIEEVSRTTEDRIILDEAEKAAINRKLLVLQHNIQSRPEVSVTYYKPDRKKSGGSYETAKGRAEKIDLYEQCILLENGPEISFDRIIGVDFP